jgi:hypothetical protein
MPQMLERKKRGERAFNKKSWPQKFVLPPFETASCNASLTANRPQHKRLHIILRTYKFNIRADCFKVLTGKSIF